MDATTTNLISENGSARQDVPDAPIASIPGANTEPAAHDLLLRLRDRLGNRLPYSYACCPPSVDDVPLEETELLGAVQEIGRTDPIAASMLHHFYNRKLRPALRRLLEVRSEEESRLAGLNARIASESAAISRKQEELEQERDSATCADRQGILETEERIARAHETAGQRVAVAGGSYEPEQPGERCVLRHERRPLESVASDLRLPWTPDDKATAMSKAVSFYATAVIGSMIGMSFGVMAGFLRPDTIQRQGPVALAWIAIGVAAALCARHFIKQGHRAASERYYLGLPATNWLPVLLLAVSVDATILYVDSLVEQQGILSVLRHANALLGQNKYLDATTYFFVAIILTFGYVGANAWDGYLLGRRSACLNRARVRQGEEYAATDAERRADPAVQTALDAIARVKELLRQRKGLERRVQEAAVPFDLKIAALEEGRRAPLDDMDEQGKRRVQDALDNYHGAQHIFDELIAAAARESVHGSRWWQRIWRAFFGVRQPRRSGREKRVPMR